MAVADNNKSHYTYADYCRWPEGERWELIDGVAYNMTPAPSRSHQRVSGELYRQSSNYLQGKSCDVYNAPFDVRLPKGDEFDEQLDTVVQPDLAVIGDLAKLDEKGCRGASDWVIEVLSPGTAAKDQIQKVELYQRHGVREYWTVHPVDRIVTVRLLDATVLPELVIDFDSVFREA